MGRVFNNKKMKERRQELRNSAPDPERLLWKRLQRSQLGVKFRRQSSVGRYVVDFYCHEAKLVIEVDGDSHFTVQGIAYDEERSACLQQFDLRILRYSAFHKSTSKRKYG